MRDAGPAVELLRALAVLAEPPEEEHRAVAEALDLPRAPTPAEYSDLFLFQLYPYASVHLGPEGMLGGEARDRVAGFWRALGHDVPSEPDHLAALIGLYASLTERAAPASRAGRAAQGSGAERRLVDEARRTLLHEHLAPWVFAFLERVGELAAPAFRAWAELLHGVLRREVEAHDPGDAAALPGHLASAPAMADPRIQGARPFVSGLLAPVRSGMIVTRADLARIAGEAGLALRAGERRYALEHLLSQSAEVVLAAVAVEAERQGDLHRARRPWLGAPASFFAERCAATSALASELAREPSLAGVGEA